MEDKMNGKKKNPKNKVRFLAGLLVVGLMIPQGVFAAGSQYEDKVAEYLGPPTTAQEKAELLVSDYGATSIQYALIDDGKMIVSGNKGIYSKTENRALTADTMYGIGSVSKMATTAVVMKLVEDGKVQLDQPVTRYLPNFRMADSRYKDITVRMLLNHSSGLMGSNYKNAFLFDDTDTAVRDGFLETLSKQSLKADPGAFSVYCNDGFMVAELVAERVTGKSFTQLLQTYIAEPLGMKNTKTPQDSFDRSNLAKTYWPGIEKALPVDSIGIIGTGGIYSTAEDMCRFLQIFMNGSTKETENPAASAVLSKETAALTAQKEFAGGIWADKDKANADGYGLGWDSVADPNFAGYGIQALNKGGDTFFYHATVTVLPGENMAAAVLSSGGSSAYDKYLAEQLLMDRLKETGRLPEKKTTPQDIVQTTPQAVAPATPKPMPISLLENNGYYGSMGGIVEVAVSTDGALSITVPETPEYEESYQYHMGSAESQEGAYFGDATGLVKVSFVKETNGKTYLKVAGPQIMPALGVSETAYYTVQKLEAAEVSEDVQSAWQQRDGKKYYQLDEKYTSAMYLLAEPSFEINLMEELPGYVFSNVMSGKNDTKTVIEIPGTMGRDLEELHAYTKDGIEYMTNYGDIAIREEGIQEIDNAQKFTYEIARDGNAVWKTVGQQAERKIVVTPPAKGAFFVYDADGDCVNASLVSGVNEAVLPEGGTVCFAGDPGAKFEIQLERFADVNPSDWYYTAVQAAADRGLFAGTEKNRFSPEEQMTQGMLAIVLQKMNEKADVSILSFKDKNVTRELLVTALYEYAKGVGRDTPTEGMAIREFADAAQVGEQAKDAVRWAIATGLLSGKQGREDSLYIDPQGEATRAEVAQILVKFLEAEKR